MATATGRLPPTPSAVAATSSTTRSLRARGRSREATMLPSLRHRRPRISSATRIQVRGGYHPDTLHAIAGKTVRLTFRREETAVCSERVVFPELGKSAMLPPYEDVTLEVTPPHAGTYEFTCQMGMLRGRLIVAQPERSRQ